MHGNRLRGEGLFRLPVCFQPRAVRRLGFPGGIAGRSGWLSASIPAFGTWTAVSRVRADQPQLAAESLHGLGVCLLERPRRLAEGF